MATGKSGYFDIAGDRGFTARIHWAETYDILTNKSNLTITSMQMQSTNWSYTWFPTGTISADGTVIKTMNNAGYATHMVSATANETWHEVKRANANVHGADPYPWPVGDFTHNADGTKSVTFTVDIQLWSSSSRPTPSIQGTKTITLTTIPRVSTLTVGNGTLGTDQTIKVTRQASSFTHTITYTCGSVTGNIGDEKTSSTSISWKPPLSLAAQNTTGTSVKATIKIETFSGSTSIGTKSYTISYAIPSSVKPTVTIATSDPKGYFDTFDGYIQNKSTCKVALTAAGNQGSTIKSYSIVCGSSSSTKSSATFNLPTSGTITITAKVTDSRGRTATSSTDITVLAYDNPKVTALNAFRTESNGDENAAKITFTAVVTPLSDKNTANYIIEYKPKDSSTWLQKALDITDYEPQDVSTIIENVDTSSSYDVRIAVTDYFGTIYSVVTTLSSRYALMHLDKGNNRIGLGKVAEGTNILDVGLDTHFRKGVTMDNPLPLESGGMGKDFSTMPASAILRNSSNDTGLWYTETTNGAYYATADNAVAKFGILPVAQGGTGGTTAIDAIANLFALNLNHITDSDYYVNSGDDLDNYTTPGAYRIPTGTIAASLVNGPVYGSAGGRLIVTATSTGSTGLFQLIIFNTSNYQIWYRIRTDASVWGKWQSLGTPHPTYSDCRYITTADGYEWFNPPMVLNTEYRTTERWNNKVVYTKLVNCGTMTNNGTYAYSTDSVKPIRFAGYTSDGALPILMEVALNSTYKLWVDVMDNTIYARMGTGYTSASIYVQVWYVK